MRDTVLTFLFHFMRQINNTYRVKSTLLLFVILGFFTSCDCMQRIQGYVVDAETGEPISAVAYGRDILLTAEEKRQDSLQYYHNYRVFTDSTGWFMDWRLASGFNCQPILVLQLEKEGYEPVRLEWKRKQSNMDTLVVKLHRK